MPAELAQAALALLARDLQPPLPRAAWHIAAGA